MTAYDSGTIEENHDRAIDEAAGLGPFGNWIDGTAHAPDGDTYPVRDPAVDQVVATVPRSDGRETDAAVATARDAFEREWAETTADERARLLRAWVETMRDHVDELALLETLEVGKPLAHARADVENGLEFFDYYASVALAQEGRQVPVGADGHAYVRNEPYGVAGQILPWNYPLLLLAWKTGAALAAGNAVVVKPAEEAPLAVTYAARLSADVLPDGVVNVVNGVGDEAGAALTGHRDVDKLSFTGSVPVGRAVMRAAADTVTPVTLELGGKNPFVVFPDADLEAAAESAAVGGLYNAGQSCDSAARVLVHEDVEDEFREHYLAAVETYSPGDPLAEGTAMGPLAFEAQFDEVRTYVDLGREEGARVLTGGGCTAEADESGWFHEPTVLGDVTPDMRVAREEVFGPVQFLMTFGSYDEAIEIANEVEYGLVAGVATTDASLAHRAAADIEAGSVWVNQYFGTVPGTPFGGYKQSGIGRECARDALAEYSRTKSVNVALDDPDV